jgi:hypothetical protein
MPLKERYLTFIDKKVWCEKSQIWLETAYSGMSKYFESDAN